MTRRLAARATWATWATWAACALLAACDEPPREGVKLMPRPAPAAPTMAGSAGGSALGLTKLPLAASAPAPGLAASSSPRGRLPVAVEPPALPSRLVGNDVPPQVQPGESTGNDRFREAVQQRLERRAATP